MLGKIPVLNRVGQIWATVLTVAAMLVLSVLFSNCGGTTAVSPPPPAVGASASGPNVMPVTIGCGYVNQPCVSVTICVPGTTSCQTIGNILLDTGSYGLRLFHQVITLALPSVGDPSVAGNTIAECVSYADGSSDWGPLARVDVGLASETASNVPMQIINSSYATAPSNCTYMDTDPTSAQFNGILGVGLSILDCGAGCEASTASDNSGNGIYFTCNSSGACKGTVAPGTLQVSNPVASLPTDNNGVILQLPLLPNNQASAVAGSLFLGIGTETNNKIGTPTVYPADAYANFITIFNGTTWTSSFIDSGSNMYFFDDSKIPQCSQSTLQGGFFCPAGELNLTATQQGASGSPSTATNFNIGNAFNDLANASVIALSDLGMESGSSDFDWGLPFFFGRSVYVGIEGRQSNLGTGPYWAY